MEDGGKEPFSELNRILDSLKQRDLGPALDWARSHRESLDTQVKKRMSSAIISRISRMSTFASSVMPVLISLICCIHHFLTQGIRSLLTPCVHFAVPFPFLPTFI